jgi:outer membrane receptor protein involved in Fe transport
MTRITVASDGFAPNTVPVVITSGHTTGDFSIGRSFGEFLTVSAAALNIGNRRFLLDNSPTFGGTHYFDPRQIYLQVRYRFKL